MVASIVKRICKTFLDIPMWLFWQPALISIFGFVTVLLVVLFWTNTLKEFLFALES